ncbi:hypothetical protein TDB9533_03514 [Thalassocella blandensis]|nr:hypothetical protein TDB9533_03514 [Thalassocella blandensis]
MTLNVAVIKTPAGVNLPDSQKSFGESGGTIGRGDGNTWVLQDPDRFLSSKHCQLSFEGGMYYLTDMSTNGTFVNGSPEPIGKGGKVVLSNGDTVELGDYQFKIDLNTAFSAAPAAPGPDPFAAPPKANSDPFASGGDPFADDPFGAPMDDPFGSSGSMGAGSAGGGADPFASDPFSSPDSGGSDPFGQSDPFTQNDPFAQPAKDFSLSPDSENVDPLAALDKANFSNTSDVFGGSSSAPSNPIGDDPFASPDVGGGAHPGSTHSDGAGVLNQAIDWPDANSNSGNLIPDDWEDDLLGGAPPVAPQPQIPPEPKAPPVAPLETPRVPEEDFHRSIPLTDPPKMPPVSQPPSAAEPLLSERPPERVEPFRSKEPEPVPQTPVSTAPTPTPPPPQTAQQPPGSSAAASKAGQTLLDAMGLGGKKLSDEEVEEVCALVGQLMPVIVTGMMQVLRSRTSIKNEFRMNVTTIQPVENNPLKFSATAEEAMENMFVRKSNAYKHAIAAFQEGFDGIGEHQVAIIAGIRAAFKGMMDSFDPERLEMQFDKQNKGVALPGMQKARYWSSYSDYFKGFVDNMENSFQYLFGDVFVEAYEDQLRKLAAERKRHSGDGKI